MRDAVISLRALPEQKALIDYAAHLVQENRSDFMLEAACERAKATILDQTFFNLHARDFENFVAMLDAPLQDKFQHLLNVKAPWAIHQK